MKITNKDKQQELDAIKWNLSQIEQKDLSGKMEYCGYCSYNKDGICQAEQKTRVEKSLCARAFNKKNNIK